jgi:hypothetical protein
MNCQGQLLGAGQVFNERTLEEGSGRIFCTYTEGPWDEVVSFPFFFLLLVFYRTYCRRSRGDVSLLLIWRPLILLHGLFSRVGSCFPLSFSTHAHVLFLGAGSLGPQEAASYPRGEVEVYYLLVLRSDEKQ